MTEKILIVEDEDHIAAGLKLNLEAEGFATSRSADGLKALTTIRAGGFDLVILDVMLPGMNGFDVCDRVRADGNHIPILFLTAKDGEDQRIHGLELGGDDYMTKPFSVRELVQRVRAILRRREWYGKQPSQGMVIKFGGNRVDFGSYSASTAQGDVALTQKECMLLKLLVEHEGKVVSRDQILETIWGYDRYPSTRTIDNLILRLRKYFELDPKQPRHLHSIYGAGYKFTAQPH